MDVQYSTRLSMVTTGLKRDQRTVSWLICVKHVEIEALFRPRGSSRVSLSDTVMFVREYCYSVVAGRQRRPRRSVVGVVVCLWRRTLPVAVLGCVMTKLWPFSS